MCSTQCEFSYVCVCDHLRLCAEDISCPTTSLVGENRANHAIPK